MAKRLRLDAELVRRGEARSRGHAQELIVAARVKVAGMIATKAATQVETSVAIHVLPPSDGEQEFASRGGHKLDGALTAFAPLGLTVQGRIALDCGASTGGFTDVLLRNDAARVYAADVGYGQLAWHLQQDPRVMVMDRTNIRDITPDMFDPRPSLVVGDLSFISLTMVLGAMQRSATDHADLVLMVKPQFEVGKDRLGKGGVVRSSALRCSAVMDVITHAQTLGLGVRGVEASTHPGPAGNVEYFVWFVPRPQAATDDLQELRNLVISAIARGPQGLLSEESAR